jgi:hypothetical protein
MFARFARTKSDSIAPALIIPAQAGIQFFAF